MIRLVVLSSTFVLGYGRFLMPWMCLERCGRNSSEINANIQQIANNLDLISAVAFERFNLGPGGTLVLNNLTNILPVVQDLGLTSFAMISSYPYPPDFIDYMRVVFQNSQPFIATAVKTCVLYGIDGLNVDWEPTTGVTEADGVAYADFLSGFADGMHAAGKILSVDVATWTPLWNLTLLANTSVDLFMTMQTYTDNFTYFSADLMSAVSIFPPTKLVVGLETVRPSDNLPYTTTQMAERFQLLVELGVQGLAIWDSPIPLLWFPFLKSWANLT